MDLLYLLNTCTGEMTGMSFMDSTALDEKGLLPLHQLFSSVELTLYLQISSSVRLLENV
jgi:hypothetical protein